MIIDSLQLATAGITRAANISWRSRYHLPQGESNLKTRLEVGCYGEDGEVRMYVS